MLRVDENYFFQPVILTEAEIEALIDMLVAANVTNSTLGDLLVDAPFAAWKVPVDDQADWYSIFGHSKKPKTRQEYMAATARPPAVIPKPSATLLYSEGVYQRGALTLHALRLKVGDWTFLQILREWVKRYANGNASTDDFIRLAQELGGDEVVPLLEKWLYDPLMPDLPEMSLDAPN